MKDIINKSKEFKYTSLEYVELDDILKSKICIDNKEMLFLYSISDEKAKIDWAANSKERFIKGLRETLKAISRDEIVKKIYIEFIPEDYVSLMEDYGFIIISEWLDFWNNDLETMSLEDSNSLYIREIKENEYQSASRVTKSCKGYSREYKGETPEWIKEWVESENTSIFVAEVDNEITGVCFVSLYGFESEKGTVLWIRELAVDPKYHSRKIGFNLFSYAINWGIKNGAKRSFLACDIENKKAIKLYEGLGYKRKTKRGQINMEKNI